MTPDPDAAAGQGAAGAGPEERLAADEQPPRSYDDLAPFRRGPEITERH
jgi:hypothetical protein